MTLLHITSDSDPRDIRLHTTDRVRIAAELATRGILFDRWDVRPISADAGTETVVNLYDDQIEDLNSDGRYQHIDLVRVHPDDSNPRWPEQARTAREKFLSEHSHAEDEVRYFAAGRGCFYLHLDPEVVAVVGEAGDLISVPAGTRHWFDMGARPDFAAIRFFEQADGWVGDFTGSPIAESFPTLDELIA
ncbi:MAG: cupin [Nocardia sp.]|nr:cupin [Nocardia sp.]